MNAVARKSEEITSDESVFITNEERAVLDLLNSITYPILYLLPKNDNALSLYTCRSCSNTKWSKLLELHSVRDELTSSPP